MPPFKKAEPTVDKPDARGKVIIKIFLLGNTGQVQMPKIGNYKTEIAVNDATVSEVEKAINTTLFT